MNAAEFIRKFEQMRQENLGRQFSRRELETIAPRYGLYFNSTMWAAGLGKFFSKGKVGAKFVYVFKNVPTNIQSVEMFQRDIFAYKHDNMRLINHAKKILRRFNIRKID